MIAFLLTLWGYSVVIIVVGSISLIVILLLGEIMKVLEYFINFTSSKITHKPTTQPSPKFYLIKSTSNIISIIHHVYYLIKNYKMGIMRDTVRAKVIIEKVNDHQEQSNSAQYKKSNTGCFVSPKPIHSPDSSTEEKQNQPKENLTIGFILLTPG